MYSLSITVQIHSYSLIIHLLTQNNLIVNYPYRETPIRHSQPIQLNKTLFSTSLLEITLPEVSLRMYINDTTLFVKLRAASVSNL